MAKITVAGCGLMGSNLVEALMEAGHEVVIVDLNEAAAAPYVARGARYEKDLANALDVDFILSNLPNNKVVMAVLSALPAGSLSGKIFVNTTSEVPSDVIKMQEYVVSQGGRYLDACILTYQGEVGPEAGYLIYSGERAAFDEIESALAALSVPVFLSEKSAVAAEIVDLVVIAIHYGYVYTLLEGIARCMQYNYPIDDYIAQTKEILEVMAAASKEHAQKLDPKRLLQQDTDAVLRGINEAMARGGIGQRVCEDMMRTTNRSVSDHYHKMMNIYLTNFEY